MQVGKRIKSVRNGSGLTQKELAMRANMSRSYLADVESDRYNPSLDTLVKIADALNTSVDRLTGDAVWCLIDNRLEELGMSLDALAEKAKVPLRFLKNIDNIMPDESDYHNVTRIAKVLALQPAVLRAALARQEPPVYDGPMPSPEECFTDFDDSVETIAAHHDSDEWTDEEKREIEKFKEFVRMKRKQQN